MPRGSVLNPAGRGSRGAWKPERQPGGIDLGESGSIEAAFQTEEANDGGRSLRNLGVRPVLRGRVVWRRDTAFLAVLLIGVTILHLAIPGPVPSGGDGGNWLALAAERFGSDVMAADVSYPPHLPFLLGLVKLVVADAVLAITIVAIASKAVLVLAVYFCSRVLTRWYALIAAVTVSAGGYLLEAYAWGGYPQLLAMGLGLLGSLFVIRYLATDKATHLWAGVLLCVATLLTHTMVGGLLGTSLVLAVFHFMYLRPGRRRTKTGLLIAGSVFGLAVLGYLSATFQGLEATINPSGTSHIDALMAAVREAPYPWLAIGILGVTVPFYRTLSDQVAATVAVGSSWLMSSLALFAFVGEPRALMVAQVGLVLLAMVGFVSLLRHLRWYRGWRAIAHPLVVISGVALVASLVTGGVAQYASATNWYRVVDQDEIEALDRLVDLSEPGDLVLASSGHHGNPIGWWVQGYGALPTYTAIDPAFLAFSDERDQAAIANEFFSDDLSEAESLAVLDEIGARYVVVDKRHSDSAWLENDFADSLRIIDASSNIVILQVPLD